METVLISNFYDESFVSAFRVVLQEFSVDLDNFNKYIEEFNELGNIYAFLLKNEQEETIGLIQFQKMELSNKLLKEEFGMIREFWIAPKFRKQGYGTELLKAAENHFTQNRINCVVLFSRPEVEVFYQKQGYSKKINVTAFNGMTVYEKKI